MDTQQEKEKIEQEKIFQITQIFQKLKMARSDSEKKKYLTKLFDLNADDKAWEFLKKEPSSFRLLPKEKLTNVSYINNFLSYVLQIPQGQGNQAQQTAIVERKARTFIESLGSFASSSEAETLLEEIFKKVPTVYNEKSKTVVPNTTKIAQQVARLGNFENIPKRLQGKKEIVLAGLEKGKEKTATANNPIETFSKLNKKFKKDMDCISAVIQNPNTWTNKKLEVIREKFINQIGTPIDAKKHENLLKTIINNNPLALFKGGDPQTCIMDTKTDEAQKIFQNIVWDKEFKTSLEFVEEMPKGQKNLKFDTLVEFVRAAQYRQTHIENTKTKIKITENKTEIEKEVSHVVALIHKLQFEKGYLPFSKQSKLVHRALLTEGSDVLFALGDSRDKFLKSRQGEKILAMALQNDPLAVEYAPKPLSKRHGLILADACISILNDKDANVEDERFKFAKETLHNILESKQELTKDGKSFNGPDGQQIQMQKTSSRQIRGLYKSIYKNNPKYLIECLQNENIREFPYFEKLVKKLMKEKPELYLELLQEKKEAKEKLEGAIKLQKKQLNNIEKNIETKQKELQDIKTKIESVKKISSLKQEIINKETEITQIKGDLIKKKPPTQAEINTAQASVTPLKQKIYKTNGGLKQGFKQQDIDKDLEVLKNEIEALKQRNSSLKQNSKPYKANSKTLNILQSIADLKEAEAQLSDLQNQAQTALQNPDLQTKITELETKLQQAENEKTNLETQKTTAEADFGNAIPNIVALQNEKAEIENNIQEDEVKKDDLEQKITENSEEAERLQFGKLEEVASKSKDTHFKKRAKSIMSQDEGPEMIKV